NLRPLAMTEGSLVNTIGSALNDPTWSVDVTNAYVASLRNGRTGARRLDLALATIGGRPLDLVRRPVTPTENVTNPGLFNQRYFSTASLRILLSDAAANITNLPTIDNSTGAVPLDGTVGTLPPIAVSSGANAAVPGTSSIGGFIKIEAQNPRGGNWRAVTPRGPVLRHAA